MPKAIDSQVSLWPQRADHPTGWEDLVASIIRSTPRLDGAACYRNPRPFDGGNDPAPALALCRSCPALLACRRQIREMTRRQREALTGVWGGQDFGGQVDVARRRRRVNQ